jgi:hypothetical protein
MPATAPYLAMMRRVRIGLIVATGLGIGVAAWMFVQVLAGEPLLSRYVVAPGADPTTLPLKVGVVDLVEVDRAGSLLIHKGTRVRRQARPRAYQQLHGLRRDVIVSFEITPKGDPRLRVGPYDRSQPLVIEP